LKTLLLQLSIVDSPNTAKFHGNEAFINIFVALFYILVLSNSVVRAGLLRYRVLKDDSDDDGPGCLTKQGVNGVMDAFATTVVSISNVSTRKKGLLVCRSSCEVMSVSVAWL
jgi:hypothetical protein